MTFDACAAAYIDARKVGWKNAKHRDQWSNTLNTHSSPVFGSLPVQAVDERLRRVPRLKKNPAARPINTMVVKGAASPNRNQAIIHGGKEIEISLIVAAGYA
jgi:hypothetical protein